MEKTSIGTPWRRRNRIMNKKLLIGLAGISILLTGCSEIIAKPDGLKDSTLIEVVDGLDKIVNNTLEKVYMNYHDSSDFRSHVLNEVLLSIAEHKITPYDELKENADAEAVALKNKIDRRMKHKFYNEISSGSYTYRSVFDEEKFVYQRIYGAENSYIVDVNGRVGVNDLDPIEFYKEGLFLPSVDKDNFDEPANKLVHFDYYTDYLEDTYLEEVYRDLLIESYVETEQSTTLGRNYAREVEYIAISNNSEHPTAAGALINAFIDRNILGPGDSNLEILANAWRGVDIGVGSPEEIILLDAGWVRNDDERDFTLYGNVIADYNKIDDNPKKTDTAIENRFTDNGAHTKLVGLQIEEDEIKQKDFIVSDWGIKNGGFGSLTEEIRSRLFNIGVANAVDFVSDDEGILADAGKWTNPADAERLPSTFVRNIGGEYYLVPKTYEKNNNRNFLFYENNTYYIVKVKEAVNSAKLSDEGNESYLSLGRSEAEIQAIEDEISQRLAELESTKSNALNFFMEDIKVVFHDESVRDYFIEQYPDIFGDN